jgi:hypothetical protein
MDKHLRDVFSNVYATKRWGDGESASGSGSSIAATGQLSKWLTGLVTQAYFSYPAIHSVLDIPCGDYNWQRTWVEGTGIRYYGGDIVPVFPEDYQPDNVSFQQLDITTSDLPSVDLVLVRDCFVHLSFAQIKSAMRNLMRDSNKWKWIAMTTFPAMRQNSETVCPAWRPLNMRATPFMFPEPFLSTLERRDVKTKYRDKSIAVWRREQLEACSFLL